MNRSKQRFLGGLAAMVASLAVAAPAAADPTVATLPVGTAAADGRMVQVTAAGGTETVADEASRSLPVGTAVGDSGAVRVSPNGAIEPLSRSVPATIVVAPGGFDWTDAGIGAGMALGVVLLAGGLLLVTRRHRAPTAPAH